VGEERSSNPPRVVGHIRSDIAGPTLVCVGGLHGNEPAGPVALQRVVEALQANNTVRRGDFLALVGNLAALNEGQRFLARDLNRHWHRHHLQPGRPAQAANAPEDIEQEALARELERAFAQARGDVFLVDLHTTSGDGKPFLVIADSLKSRRFALQFPSPLVLGLEEHLDGTLIDVVTNLGHAAIAFEGGRNDSPDSVDHSEAAIWTALHAAGLIAGNGADPAAAARASLRRVNDGLPAVVEILYRHPIEEGDEFRMRPKFGGFDVVRAGQPLADDSRGEITAPSSGYLLMPLYQQQGDDGFFVVHAVRKFWLPVSAALRKLHVDHVVPWLPGVHRDPEADNGVIVNRAVARWFAVQVLHLLGFKKVREVGGTLYMRRRGGLPL
jgi:succinylglutamate desuccinylase